MTPRDAASAGTSPDSARARVPAIPLGPWVEWATRLEVRGVEIEARFDRPVRAQDPLNVVARGLVGERLRDLRCLTRAPTCAGCADCAGCDYGVVFDDPSGASEGGTEGSGAPRPYWMQGIPAVQELAAGATLRVRLFATGPALRALPFLDVALRDALARLGVSRAARREGVRLGASRPVDAKPDRIVEADTLHIVTTAPIVLRGNWDAAREACPAAPWMALLLRGAVRRLDQLATTFGPGDARRFAAFPPLEDVEVVSGGLSRWAGARFSHKQARRMPIEGLLGEATVRGRGLLEATPLLAAATRFGVGKLTSMGFGCIAVTSGR